MSESGPSPWSERGFKEGDEGALVALFLEVFGRPMTVEHWRWKLGRSGSAPPNVWLATDADDRPIFHYGGIPCRAEVEGRESPVMVAVDGMTSPGYRRRGILTRVVGRAHASWREAGVAFVLGLPNDQWGSRLAAVGWQPILALRWRIRPLRPALYLARRLGWRALAGWRGLDRCWNMAWPRPPEAADIEVVSVATADEGFDQAWQRCRDGRIGLVHDRRWVRWRYLDCPDSDYRLLLARRDGEGIGYLAYRVSEEGIGLIADLTAPPGEPEVEGHLLAAALRRFAAEGARAAATLAIPGSAPSRRLTRWGFLWSWGSFPVCVVPLNPPSSGEELRDPARWRLVGGDFDVV